MSAKRAFIDSNILVYAYDLSAGIKHEKASVLIHELWEAGTGCISTQVLQEFVVVVTKKIPKPLPLGVVAQIVEDLLRWEVVVNDGQSILEAITLQQKHQLSFWDAMVVASAVRSSAHTLLSEDLNNRQHIQGIVVQNPLI